MSSVIEKPPKSQDMLPAAGKARLKVETDTGQKTFYCLFNPEEYNLNVQGKFSTKDRSQNNSPITQYAGGEADSLDLTLFFDTSTSSEINLMGTNPIVRRKEAADVSDYTKELTSLIRMDGKLHRPPIVEFCWGNLNFSGFVDRVGVQYTMFELDGKPVRAKVTLHMQSADNGDGKGNPKQSPDRTKSRVLTADASIWSIAYAEYGDTRKWRLIAKANHIMDPMKIPEGTILSLPPLLL